MIYGFLLLDNLSRTSYLVITLKGSSYRSEKWPIRNPSARSKDPEPAQLYCKQDLYPGIMPRVKVFFILDKEANHLLKDCTDDH